MDTQMDIKIKIIYQNYLSMNLNYNNNFYRVLKRNMIKFHQKKKSKKIEIIFKNYWIKMELQIW